MRRLERLTLEHVAMAAIVAIGAVVIAGPVSDNSLLTHIRTGRDIAHNWSVPSVDSYSYTAAGTHWTVQSWLAEASYGLLDRLGGLRAIVYEHVVLGAILAALVVALARVGSMIGTACAAGIPMALLFEQLAPRPFLFGLVCLALLIFVVDRRKNPWLLLPVAWVWVNTHGSWPLGLFWFTLTIAGTLLDERRLDRDLTKAAGLFGVGVLLGAVNPVGPKILWFWSVAVGERSHSFADIVEWASLDFRTVAGTIAGLGMLVVVAVCFRQKVDWRRCLPVVAFAFAAMYSARNVTAFAVVSAPALRMALTTGTLPSKARPARDNRMAVIALGLVVVMALTDVARVALLDPFEGGGYPIAALAVLKDQKRLEPNHRLAAREYVGNYLEWAEPDVKVFIDDRFDMYPISVSNDYDVLFKTTSDPLVVLDKYGVDTVLWERKKPLTQVLTKTSTWRLTWSDDDWAVFERTT